MRGQYDRQSLPRVASSSARCRSSHHRNALTSGRYRMSVPATSTAFVACDSCRQRAVPSEREVEPEREGPCGEDADEHKGDHNGVATVFHASDLLWMQDDMHVDEHDKGVDRRPDRATPAG